MTTAEKLYTREEFAALPMDVIQGCELVDGRIVKKRLWEGEEMGMTPGRLIHAEVVRLIWRALDRLPDTDFPIRVFAEALFDVGTDRERTRRPDLAVIARDLPTDPELISNLLPAMVVEVVSPHNETLSDWDKVEEYLAAGVQLVWLALPPHRTIIAFWPDRATMFRSGDVITAEPVLPGFNCEVAELFPSQPQPSH